METQVEKKNPDFLTVNQVAEALQVSRPTVYRLFHDRKLTPVKIGSATRIRRSELDKIG